MVITDTLEGSIDQTLWYHYDLANDVLYLRLVAHRGAETVAEETPEGFLLRRTDNDEVVGLTVVNWWKRFGPGGAPDSIKTMECLIEPWAGKIAA
jgi:hypothetical protein